MAAPDKTAYRICVYCQKCGKIAPTASKDARDDFGNTIYNWHQPCSDCGSTAWATKFIGSVTPFGKR